MPIDTCSPHALTGLVTGDFSAALSIQLDPSDTPIMAPQYGREEHPTLLSYLQRFFASQPYIPGGSVVPTEFVAVGPRTRLGARDYIRFRIPAAARVQVGDKVITTLRLTTSNGLDTLSYLFFKFDSNPAMPRKIISGELYADGLAIKYNVRGAGGRRTAIAPVSSRHLP